jgi:hypothetical protein
MVMTGSPLASNYAIDGQSLLPGPFSGAAPAPWAASPFAALGAGVLGPQFALDPEAQALQAFMQGVTSCLIPKLSSYIGRNISQFPQLSHSVPLITRAAELYGARDYARALAQVYHTYRLVALLRLQQPGLPDPTLF